MAKAAHAFSSTLKSFKTASGKAGKFYALPALAKQFPNVSRLPEGVNGVKSFNITFQLEFGHVPPAAS